MSHQRVFACTLLVVIVSLFPKTWAHASNACGDPDGSGTITITDGVNVLRFAADLPSTCVDNRIPCDLNADGAVTVVDAVNVLRAAADLSATLACAAEVNPKFIACGQRAAVDIPAQGFVDLMFDAQANEEVAISLRPTGNYPLLWRLLSPNGDDLIFGRCGSPCNVSLPQAGTYTLRLRREINAPDGLGTVSLEANSATFNGKPSTSCEGAKALRCGDATEDLIEADGDLDTVVFDGIGGDQLFVTLEPLDSFTFNFSPRWHLFGPDGYSETPSDGCEDEGCFSGVTQILRSTGRYALRVADRYRGTGRYLLKLNTVSSDFVTQCPGMQVLRCPATASGTLRPVYDHDFFGVQAAAGDVLRITTKATSNGRVPSWAIRSPISDPIAITPGGEGECVGTCTTQPLPVPSTYVVVVRRSAFELPPLDYQLRIDCQ